jgi:hypothetical protein
LQIKGVKKEDALRYLLSGLRDDEGKKIRNVTLSVFIYAIETKIGFYDRTIADKIGRYLMEKPLSNED